jgi:transcriptional regulator with XRE-family HTH domain
MNQRELAKAAGITQATLVDLEHGRGRPRASTMRKVAEALGVEPTAIAEFRRVIEADPLRLAA